MFNKRHLIALALSTINPVLPIPEISISRRTLTENPWGKSNRLPHRQSGVAAARRHARKKGRLKK